jgi:hypothetical protein
MIANGNKRGGLLANGNSPTPLHSIERVTVARVFCEFPLSGFPQDRTRDLQLLIGALYR